MELQSHIEGLLFLAGKPLDIKKIAQVLNKEERKVREALGLLEKKLSTRGVRLIKNDDEVSLGTAPEAAGYLEKFVKQELNKSIGRAGLEVLAVILYKGLHKEATERGGVSRSEIDYIRGVNSTFTIRNLLIRGLIKRKQNPKDKRTFVYTPSSDLLRYLGITRKEELPSFEEYIKKIDKIENATRHDQAN
jgi:segregation and condensation protein B